MKFHLPCPLLRLLMILAALSTAQAAVRHTDVSTMTYVDFATNSGRYVTGTTNETTGETVMTNFTTYNAYNLNQVDVTDAYLTNAESKDIEYLLYKKGGTLILFLF